MPANTLIKASEAKLAAAENEAKAILATAEAEHKSKKDLETKRAYEIEFARLDVMKMFASKGRRVITGEAGAAILNDISPQTGANLPSKGGMFS